MNNPNELFVLSSAAAAATAKKSKFRPRRTMHALESRFVFDGALVASLTPDAVKALVPTANAPIQVVAANAALDGGKHEAVFIDTSTSNWQALVSGVEASRPGVAIELIDGGQNGLAQIATWAATHNNYDAIHILSHSSEASLDLGTQNLNVQNLQSYSSQLTTIGNALNSHGDILLYGCNLAAGSDGASFVQTLAQDTHATVAASTDATGAASKGGNWTLEYQTGTLDVSALRDVSYQDTLNLVNADFTSVGTGATMGTATTGNTVTSATISGEALQITGAGTQLDISANSILSQMVPPAPQYGFNVPLSGSNISLATSADGAGATSLTFTLVDGKAFTLSSMLFADIYGGNSNTAYPWTIIFTSYTNWQADPYTRIYPPSAARLTKILVVEGQEVRKGDVLFVLESPSTDWQLQAAQERIAGIKSQLAGSVASSSLLEKKQGLEQELAEAEAELNAQTEDNHRLQIVAPHDGVFRDLDNGLYPGAWLSMSRRLGLVVGKQDAYAQVFVNEAHVGRISIGAHAKIITRASDANSYNAVVTDIDKTATIDLPEPMLASPYGGPIAAHAGSKGEMTAHESLYRVTLKTEGTANERQLAAVSAYIDSERSSFLLDSVRKAVGVVIRESGL